MRRFFKWFGIGVVGLLALAFAFAFWLIGGPQEIWGELFPTQYYDNVEVKLVIDGEPVTVTGTAFCSSSKRRIPILGYKGGKITRTGGAAATVMSDGRAVIIPYSDREYCHGAISADGYYDDWWEVFDKRFSLKGNIDILIMDEADYPSEMELIDGPGYFRNQNASIKLISADRWRSEQGEETYFSAEWLEAEVNLSREQRQSRQWIGALVYKIDLAAESNATEQVRLMVGANLENEARELADDEIRRLVHLLRQHVSLDAGVDVRPVYLSGDTARLHPWRESFRFPLRRLSVADTIDDFVDGQSVISNPGCYGAPAPWPPGNRPTFFRSGDATDIAPVLSSSFLFGDPDSGLVLFANTICVDLFLFR